jgi:hypothetical protein
MVYNIDIFNKLYIMSFESPSYENNSNENLNKNIEHPE